MFLTAQLILIFLMATNFIPADSHCVNDEVGNDEENCTRNDLNAPCCKSLQFLIKTLTRQDNVCNISIQIQSSIVMDSVLEIRGFENLTILGGNSTISCSLKGSGNSGIYIGDVRKLKLSHFAITGCSMVQYSSAFTSRYEEMKCAVYVVNSTDVTIEKAVITHNIGTGLVIYDTAGYVNILNSSFEDNKIFKVHY